MTLPKSQETGTQAQVARIEYGDRHPLRLLCCQACHADHRTESAADVNRDDLRGPFLRKPLVHLYELPWAWGGGGWMRFKCGSPW